MDVHIVYAMYAIGPYGNTGAVLMYTRALSKAIAGSFLCRFLQFHAVFCNNEYVSVRRQLVLPCT